MVKLPNTFTAWDFVVFVGMLVISMGIGIYFALKGDKQRTKGEYLLGGRSMPLLPVAISILVSFLSAILMLGTPAEVYNQGTEWVTSSLGQGLGFVIAGIFFVPLLYPLGFTSSYEYLEKRFHSRAVRLLGNLIFCIGQITYMGIASYAPSTALEALTGFPVWGALLITGFVATFYTAIGGMKAVVWTDVFQAAIMLAGILSVAIQGTIKVGGFNEVWDLNKQYDRVRFITTDIDPRVRHTIWGLIIGSCTSWMGNAGLNQSAVQRYCSLPTLKHARAAVIMNALGIMFLMTITSYTGMVMFAYYAKDNCDLMSQKVVGNSNQLVPYFVMEILAYPTIPGLFMSSLFSGALSSISSSLNSLSATTWEDVLKPLLAHRLTEYRQTVLLKVLVVVYGCVGIAVSFTISFLDGTVVQAAVSFLGPTAAISGIFILGALFPFANKYGAFMGGLCGMVGGMLLSVGSYWNGIKNIFLKLPTPNGTCTEPVNSTYAEDNQTLMSLTTTLAPFTPKQVAEESTDALHEFYSVSYLWVSTVAVLTCIIVGVIVSLITRPLISKEERHVPTKYQIPVSTRLFCCLSDSMLYYLNCCREFETPEEIKRSMQDVEMVVHENDIPEKSGNYDIRTDKHTMNGHNHTTSNGKSYESDKDGYGHYNAAFVKDDPTIATSDEHPVTISNGITRF